MTLACEDANSKLVEVVTVADVDVVRRDFEVEVQSVFAADPWLSL